MKRIRADLHAVIFDVYGTLLEIPKPRRPYRKLLDISEKHGCIIDSRVAAHAFMSQELSLAQAAAWIGAQVTPSDISHLNALLAEELASARLFPDVVPALARLREAGLRLALCSNLALPYVGPARLLLEPLVDVSVWSCEVGHLKPSREMFDAVLDRLEAPADSVLMVGDDMSADIEGARAAGMAALLLDRSSIQAGPDRIENLLALIN